MGISIVTLQGMNTAYSVHHDDKNIFDGIRVPELIDEETLINRIVLRCGEFSMMHTDYEWLHEQILNFFLVHYDTFNKWAEVLNMEYDPLENYRRHEIWHDQGDETHEDEKTDTSTLGSSSTLTKSAFNESGYSPYEKTTESGVDTLGSDSDGSSDYRSDHEGTISGNIGVTTSQQMAQAELDLRRFNIYLEISNLFADEFCVMVY